VQIGVCERDGSMAIGKRWGVCVVAQEKEIEKEREGEGELYVSQMILVLCRLAKLSIPIM